MGVTIDEEGEIIELGLYRTNLEFSLIENVLEKDNTTPFTPTENYNPATKKYVDDAISNNITSALGGEY